MHQQDTTCLSASYHGEAGVNVNNEALKGGKKKPLASDGLM